MIADAPRAPAPHENATDGPLILSARSETALKALAGRYGDHLNALAAGERAAVAAAAAYGRDALEHRLVVLEEDADARIAALRAFAGGAADDSALVTGSGAAGQAPVVFAYTGNGAQWAGMGTAAYRGNAVFRDAFDRLDRKFMSLSGWSLVTMLYSADLECEIERTEIAQPLLLAIQIALTEALAAKGIMPDAVIGHSVGEVAAAWAAGMIDLDAAVRIIHARSTHQEMIRHLGGMAALLLSAEEARAAIAEAGLPASRSPRSTVRARSPFPVRPKASMLSASSRAASGLPCAGWHSTTPSTAIWWTRSANRFWKASAICTPQSPAAASSPPSIRARRSCARCRLLVGQRARARALCRCARAPDRGGLSRRPGSRPDAAARRLCARRAARSGTDRDGAREPRKAEEGGEENHGWTRLRRGTPNRPRADAAARPRGSDRRARRRPRRQGGSCALRRRRSGKAGAVAALPLAEQALPAGNERREHSLLHRPAMAAPRLQASAGPRRVVSPFSMPR